MKRFFASLALACIAGAAHAQDIKLCHIANSGFMAEGRNSAVLFDAVRLKDTFDGDYAMPPEAFEMLKAGKARPEDLARVTVVLPSEDAGPITQEIGDVTIEAYRVSHGEGGPQNIGYRVTLDGVRIFHTGDIAADKESLRRAGLRHTEVDIMLMPFWYGLNNAEQSEAAAFAWQIDTVVPMHFAPKEEKWMKEYGGFDMLVKHVHDQWPKSRKVLGEMNCERFSTN